MDKFYVRQIIDLIKKGYDLETATRAIVSNLTESQVLKEAKENRFLTRGIPINVLRSRLHVLFRSKAKRFLQNKPLPITRTTVDLVSAGIVASAGLGVLGAFNNAFNK